MAQLIPPTSLAEARLVAASRLAFVLDTLRSIQEGQRFVERPVEEAPGTNLTYRGTEGAALVAATFARLRWQLAAEPLLLLERVSDAVEARLRNANLWPVPHGEKHVVGLQRLPSVKRRPSLFPWHVRIETSRPEIFDDFVELRQWFGVGISTRPPRPFELLGQCQAGPGLEGVVGGMLSDAPSGLGYAVTCQHVLAPDCGSKVPWPPSPEPNDGPDAELLNAQTPCFATPRGFGARPVRALGAAEVYSYISDRKRVTKMQPGRQIARGRVAMLGSAITIGDRCMRFPFALVKPHVRTYMFGTLTWPPVASAFSRPGDSGSWVYGESPDAWLGLLAGASPEDGSAVVLTASELLLYFERLLTASRTSAPPSNLQPFGWFSEDA